MVPLLHFGEHMPARDRLAAVHDCLSSMLKSRDSLQRRSNKMMFLA
jgi:hypothetical protein